VNNQKDQLTTEQIKLFLSFYQQQPKKKISNAR